jgi:hypothetical protein
MMREIYVECLVKCGFDKTIAELVCEDFARKNNEGIDLYVQMVEALKNDVGKVQS